MSEDGVHLHRAIVLERPRYKAGPSTWVGHIPFAFWIVEQLRPRLLVELGTYNGCSYCAFCQAVDRLKLSTACYAVDTWKGDAHSGSYPEVVFDALAAYHDAHYRAFSTLLRTSFDEASTHFADGTVDLLHIDGYHTYEAVSHDFETWRPKLSSRAVVLLHDTNVRALDFGVWRFWEEMTRRHPGFAFLHSCGLGVLAVGDDVPEAVRWLVEDRAAAPDRDAMIRDFFERLGTFTQAEAELRFATELMGDPSDPASQASQVRVYRAQMFAAQAEVESMRASKSWRVTAPLRRLYALASGIRAAARSTSRPR